MMHAEIYAVLRNSGLLAESERPELVELTGGVSSEIYRLDTAQGAMCIKRSLPKLRVKQDWYAPVERGDYEVAWIKAVAEFSPLNVPAIVAESKQNHFFVMRYFGPEEFPLWKTQLRDGDISVEFAAAVGACLGRIHATTAGRTEIAERFDNNRIFDPIRIDPYLRATASDVTECRESLLALAQRTLEEKHALIHGDVSPKNILHGRQGPVFLDAECACYGDPAFDLAFCLNHLLLKCIWRPSGTKTYLRCFEALFDAYRARVDWENVAGLEVRAAALLAAFLLARIDGKSPVEYIVSDEDRDCVRAFAKPRINGPPASPLNICRDWLEHLTNGHNG